MQGVVAGQCRIRDYGNSGRGKNAGRRPECGWVEYNALGEAGMEDRVMICVGTWLHRRGISAEEA